MSNWLWLKARQYDFDLRDVLGKQRWHVPPQVTPHYVMNAETGYFNLRGYAVASQAGRLQADAGMFALTGFPALLLRQYIMPADTGFFVVTGNGAALTYSGSGGAPATYNMDADTGYFRLFGDTGPVMQADTGYFAYSGFPATLTYRQLTMVCDTGYFALTGNPATLTYTQVVMNYVQDMNGDNVLDMDGDPVRDLS